MVVTNSEPLIRARGSDIGKIIADTYRLTRCIGAGGSSEVFEAEHVRLGKLFALKLLHPDVASTVIATQRLRREAAAIARIQHENVVSVCDCGELNDGTPYLVMELLVGEDLRSLLAREGSLPLRRALRVALDVASGLTSVHAAGLVHRDLKPENLFITRRSSGLDCCKILDFGVAKMPSTLRTGEGSIVGTVRYMSPEQLANGSDVGITSDVYAVGAILFECLTGRPVHEGATVEAVMYGIMNNEPPRIRDVCPALPRDVEALIQSTLSKAPQNRPQSATELAARLVAIGGDSAGADSRAATVPDGVVPRPSRRVHRGGLLGPVLLAGAIGSVTGWSLRGDSIAVLKLPTRNPLPHPSAEVPLPSFARRVPTSSSEQRAAESPFEQLAPAASALLRPNADEVTVDKRQRLRKTPTPGVSAKPAAPPIGRLDAVNPYEE